MVALPKDVATLQAMVRSAQVQIAAREADLAAREADVRNRDLIIEKLRHQIAGLRRQRYGVSSESLDQLELALEDEEVARAATPVSEPPVRKTQPRRRALPEHLPREETVLDPGERCARLRRGSEAPGRGRHRGVGIRSGPVHRQALRASPARVHPVRELPSGAVAGAPHRARTARTFATRPRAGLEVLRLTSAVSSEPDLRPRGGGAGALDARRLGGQGDGVA